MSTPVTPGLTDLESVTKTAYGSITAASVQCSATSCVWIVVPTDYQSVSVLLSGVFNATLQFELSWDGITWGAAHAVTGETSTSSTGFWDFNLNRAAAFRVRASAFTSGPVQVNISARYPGVFGQELPNSSWSGDQDAAGHNLLNANVINAQQYNVKLGSGLLRWSWAAQNTEGGGNSGSDLVFTSYQDGQSFLATPMTIARATGIVNFSQSPTVNGVPMGGQTPWLGNIDGGGFKLTKVNQIALSGDVGGSTPPAQLTYQNLGSTRFSIVLTGTEGGSNSGSDYTVNRADDTGTSLGTAMIITRATGLMRLGNSMTVPTGSITIGDPTLRAIPLAAFGAGAAPSLTVLNGIAIFRAATTVGLEVGALPGTPYNAWIQVTNKLGGAGTAFPLSLQPMGGSVAIAMATAPAYPLDVSGDINCSGNFRKAGVILAQTPWTSDIAGAAFNLNNVNQVQAKSFLILGQTATPGVIYWYNGGQPRWQLRVLGSESTNNLGSDLSLGSYTDAAGNLATPIIVTRATSLVTLAGPLAMTALPSVAPAAGSKQLYYDPADSNRVKYVP